MGDVVPQASDGARVSWDLWSDVDSGGHECMILRPSRHAVQRYENWVCWMTLGESLGTFDVHANFFFVTVCVQRVPMPTLTISMLLWLKQHEPSSRCEGLFSL